MRVGPQGWTICFGEMRRATMHLETVRRGIGVLSQFNERRVSEISHERRTWNSECRARRRIQDDRTLPICPREIMICSSTWRQPCATETLHRAGNRNQLQTIEPSMHRGPVTDPRREWKQSCEDAPCPTCRSERHCFDDRVKKMQNLTPWSRH